MTEQKEREPARPAVDCAANALGEALVSAPPRAQSSTHGPQASLPAEPNGRPLQSRVDFPCGRRNDDHEILKSVRYFSRNTMLTHIESLPSQALAAE